MIHPKSITAWVLLAICVLLFLVNAIARPVPFVFKLETRSARCARLQVFYDASEGIRHQGVDTHWTGGSTHFKTVRFRIDGRKINNLRLVQVNGAEPVELRSISLRPFAGHEISIGASNLKALGGIDSITTSNGIIKIIPGPHADGTAVAIQLPASLPQSRLLDWLHGGAIFVLGCAAILFLWLDRPSHLRSSNKPEENAKASASAERAYQSTSLRASGFRLKPRTWVVALLTAAYLLASVFELNGSSSSLWRFFADGQRPDTDLVAGSPEEVRVDEWETHTSWILSQSMRIPSFPLVNPNIGDGKIPLLTNLPVRHWSMLFRPQMWPFFFAGLERAFAFYWNFKWFGLLLAAFLFFELLTRGQTLLALNGALFLSFSPYIQWWFSTPTFMPEMLAMFFFVLWSVLVVLRAPSRWQVAGASLVFIIALAQFVFCCYPRFQVPLFYLGAVVIAALFFGEQRQVDRFRRACLTGAILCAALIVFIWYGEVRDLLHQISQLLYPGKIVSKGGAYPWFGLIAPFLEFSMSELNSPQPFMNVCEAAGFLFVLPLLLAILLRDLIQRRFDLLFLALVAFALLTVIFMIAGVPMWLAKLSGWSYVYATRANLVVGVASIMALVRYFSRDDSAAPRVSFRGEILLFIAITVLFFGLFRIVNIRMAHFVPFSGVCFAAAFFALVFVCLWTRRTGAAWALLLVPTLYVNALINPIERGLPGFTQNEAWHWLRENQRADPHAKWLVLAPQGHSRNLAEFVKSTGADVLGGMLCMPDRKVMQLLDSSNKNIKIYDRFALAWFVPGIGPEPAFNLTFVNSYEIQLPLQSDIFERLGVHYILAVDLPKEQVNIPGFKAAGERGRCRLLVRDGG
jgi:hypothetical protein